METNGRLGGGERSNPLKKGFRAGVRQAVGFLKKARDGRKGGSTKGRVTAGGSPAFTRG